MIRLLKFIAKKKIRILIAILTYVFLYICYLSVLPDIQKAKEVYSTLSPIVMELYENHQRDHYSKYFYSDYRSPTTNIGRARMTAGSVNYLSDFIKECKRVPSSYKDFYLFKSHSMKKCPTREEVSKYDERDEQGVFVWLDPWGRPYQIRYDLEREKIQLRSQGRYLWTEQDDILEESSFIGKDYSRHKYGEPTYLKILKDCENPARNYLTCIFNRGWH